MTKYMILKSFLALFILTSFSCGKKDDRKIAPKADTNLTRTSKASSDDASVATSQSADNTSVAPTAQKNSIDSTTAVPNSIDVTQAAPTGGASKASADQTGSLKPAPTGGAAKPVSADVTSVAKPASKPTAPAPKLNPAQPAGQAVSQDQTKPKAQPAAPVSIDATVAANSADPQISEDEKSAILKVKVLNQKLITDLLNQANKVVYRSKVVDAEKALKDLKNANEDSFCGLTGDISFADQKMVAVTAINKKLVDQAADIFETEITLMSQNKKSSLKCVHTTSNFYIEQFALNMSAYFEVWNDTKKMDSKDFKNPRTMNRILNAVKIKNLKMLQDAGALEDRKALVSGRLVSEAESLDLLKSGKERTACVIAEMSKSLDLSKVYIRVDKMMGPDKYADVIEQHTIYRADKDNYFVLQCMMNKKLSQWYDLMNVAKGVLQFGVLNRTEYNKTYDDVKALNEKLKSAE